MYGRACNLSNNTEKCAELITLRWGVKSHSAGVKTLRYTKDKADIHGRRPDTKMYQRVLVHKRMKMT